MHVIFATYLQNVITLPCKMANNDKSDTAVAERPRCRVGQFWPKVDDDILQTI